MIGLPNIFSINLPTGLLSPKMMINRKPTTVGGSTRGKVKIVSTAVLPKKRFRDKILAVKVPKKKTVMTDIDAISIDSFIGIQKSLLT
jgi:alcohol dehydrogenase class IV